MKILITGGTGCIGREFIKRNPSYSFTILTRDASRAIEILGSNFSYLLSLSHVDISDYDAVINLAGEPIFNKRWSASQKNKIKDSRFLITNQLSSMILSSKNPPKVFISASAVGIYGFNHEGQVTEKSCLKDCFGKKLCVEWERLALLSANRTRVCIPRIGIVLSKEGIFLKRLSLMFNLYLGGFFGNGSQLINWIHINDMVSIIKWMLENDSAVGVYNAVAESPESSMDFYKILGKSMNRPVSLRFPEYLLNFIFGEMAELITKGENIVPERLLLEGYDFIYKDLRQSFDSMF